MLRPPGSLAAGVKVACRAAHQVIVSKAAAQIHPPDPMTNRGNETVPWFGTRQTKEQMSLEEVLRTIGPWGIDI